MLYRCPRAKVGCLPSRNYPFVSAKVTVLCVARTYQLKRNLADRKVRRGGFRWLDNFTIEEIPRDQAQRQVRLPFCGMPGLFCMWAPRPSGRYIVMQARWGS